MKKVFLPFFCIYMKLRMFVCVLVTQLCLILYGSKNCSSTKLVSAWNFPGKNTGPRCLSLLQDIFLTQGSNLGHLYWRQILLHLSHQGSLKNVCEFSCFSHVQLCDPIDCSMPRSSVHWIFQARVLEWVARPSFRGSSWFRDQTQVSYISCIVKWVLCY